MFRRIATLALIIGLSTCGGPQALAQPAPAPITDAQLAQIGQAAQSSAPAATVTTPAQSIAPIANPDGSWNFVPLMNGFQQFLLGVLEAVLAAIVAWVGAAATKYLGVHIDLKQTAQDLNLNSYADTVAQQAIAYARQRTGLTDDQLKDVQLRNPFLALAAGFVLKLDPTVWAWVSKQETGVMQWIEAHLSPDAALPTKVVDGVGVIPPKA